MPYYSELGQGWCHPSLPLHPLLPRLYLSVLCNKIIKEDSALHCGRQRSPQTLETRIRMGSGGAEEGRKSARNRKIVVDAMRETEETWVEREKNIDKKGLVQ